MKTKFIVIDMSDDIDMTAIIERPVYTKDDQYVGVIQDIDKENEDKIGNLIIRGNLDLRKYSIPRKFIVNFYDGKVLLDMTRDDFISYEI
ncbi:MAG TPA: PRC-barrel domain-containing protein [Nitrososphaeraceae archaeon]|nr:PRC-barrel domain-containing protein [Nitrososphaeraceae archaeon]